jgi:MFS family permease
MLAAVIGNALEHYDFAVFGFFTFVISKLFFPPGDELAALLLTSATFGVGFLARPLGGILLAVYADRHGRRAGLQAVMGITTASMLLLTLAPTYAMAGIAGPIILLIARMLGGFAFGGQYGVASAFLLESAPPGRRGFYVAYQQLGIALAALAGTLAGLLVTSLLSPEQQASWGWRLPFAAGLLIAPVGLWVRRYLQETEEFAALRASAPPPPPLQGVGAHWPRLLAGFGMVMAPATQYYVLIAYMPTFVRTQLHLTLNDAFGAQTIALIAMAVMVMVAGAWSDRVGRRLPMALGLAGTFVCLLPLFHWLSAAPSFARLVVTDGVLCSFFGLYMGPIGAAISEQFPANLRSTASSVVYNLPVVVFGGFALFIVTWLISTTGQSIAAAYYVMFGVGVALCAVTFIKPHEEASG